MASRSTSDSAHLTHANTQFGFVDVPGHERFVKNMLAGAAGIDSAILVIGADESIKPQTREHFDICRLLGIRHGLIALTKADLVDPELLELVNEAAEFAAGSFLEDRPILAVSGTTGQGLAELRDALVQLSTLVPPRDTQGPFRLPIDRSFTLHGFGTVVTGTLASGCIRLEDEVEVHPQGRRLRSPRQSCKFMAGLSPAPPPGSARPSISPLSRPLTCNAA